MTSLEHVNSGSLLAILESNGGFKFAKNGKL